MRFVKILVFIFSLAALTSSYASGLTEESVKRVISKIDNAVNTLNSQDVSDALSDDVEIVMHISMQGHDRVLKPSKKEYISVLKQSWSMYTNYEYDRSNVVISIKENRALVSADVKESMVVQGQKISGESKEEIVVEVVDGVPLVTKITGYTSM